MVFWSVVSSVVGLSFAAEAAGLFTHELNAALAGLFLLIAATLDPSLRGTTLPGCTRWLLGGAVAAVTGLLLTPADLSIRCFALSLWFWGLSDIAAARGNRSPAFVLAVGCLLGGLFQCACRTSPLVWYATQDASRHVSGAAGQLVGRPLDLGPSFTGAALVVLAVSICLAGFALTPKRRLRRLLASVILVLLAHLAYLCLFARLSDFAATADQLHPVHLPLMQPPLLALVIGWFLRGPREQADAPPIDRPDFVTWSLMVLAWVAGYVAVRTLSEVPGHAPRRHPTVALYEKGFLNWDVPTHERYGARSAGMFGNMPRLLDCMGWRSEFVGEITDRTLADKDVLVLINQRESLPAESLEAIDAFLQDGGGLLVLGDHTFWNDQKKLALNDPLSRTHIRYRFDSADYFVGGWLHSLQFWPHPITAGVADSTNECGSVVGASLEIRDPAIPLVIGRWGYSDRADSEDARRGYLGNLTYDPGEMLGDVVLAAAERIGQGRIVVIGDTSGFVNAIQTQTWPFVRNVFWWLGGEGPATLHRYREPVALVLLALTVILVLVASRRLPVVWLPVAAVFFATGWTSQRVPAEGDPLGPGPLEGHVSVVDLSHVGRHSLEGWRPNGVAGVYMNLMRDGYFAIGSRRFDERQIRACDVFVTIAPTKPYTAAELDVLRSFMNEGGVVILAVGWEERSGAMPLLETADMQLVFRPLGHASADPPTSDAETSGPRKEETASEPGAARGDEHSAPQDAHPPPPRPSFWKAWPVRGGEPLVTVEGEPVVARTRFGRGQLIVIADSDFLLNKNLETEEGAISQNVRFFSWLLDRIKEEDPSP